MTRTYPPIEGFFVDRYRDSALMLEQLLGSDQEPDCLFNDVAFVYEKNPWIETVPLRGPTTVVSINHRSRTSWFRIEDPADRYEGLWGDIDERGKANSGNGDKVFFSGRVDPQIVTGIGCH